VEPSNPEDPAAPAQAALRRSDERLAFLNELRDALRSLRDPVRIVAEACQMLGVHLRANRVGYAEFDGDECTVVADYTDGVAWLAGRFRWKSLAGAGDEEVGRDAVLVVTDASSDPRTTAVRDALQDSEIAAYINPVLIVDGRLVASLGVQSRTPRTWTPD